MASTTRSRRLAADLSPEVEWYLQDRGYDLSTVKARPLIRTPEPRNVKGAEFHPDRVDHAIAAMRQLRHTKGNWAGQPLEMAAVQVAYIIAPVFGWVRWVPNVDRPGGGDWRRIIRDVYVEMPRKGAKTTTVSGLAMVLGFADGEPGAEVILGAASRDQAGQAYKPLEQLARSSPVLAEAGIKPTKKEIVRASDGSVVKAVSSRGDLAHGANVSGALVDELHVHKSPDLLEAIESGTGARAQPLVFIITTADDGQTTSVYAQRRDMIEKLAGRVFKNPSMYGVVFAAEESDDPFAESTWAKCNPLYPVTPSPEFMRSAADKARSGPVALASFLRLHLGIRAKQATRFIDLPKWDRNASIVDELALKGRVAYGGIDLGSVSDLTAVAWLFPDADRGGYDLLCRFWAPAASLERLDARTQNTASAWVKQGHLTLTPGEVTDYDFIVAQLGRDMDAFDVRAIGYDPWNATQPVNDMVNAGAPMVTVRQGFVSLSPPMKELERLVLSGTAARPLLRHGGNPVLRWMVDNLRPAMDAAGNVKPDKKTSMDKIDGVSATVTGLALAMVAEPEARSAYTEDRGLLIV